MITRAHIVFAVVLSLIAGAAALLSRIQSMQKIGVPGVRLIPRTVLGEGGKVVGTNTVDLPERVLHYASETRPMPDEVVNWLPKDTTLAQRIYTASNSPLIQLDAVVMGTDRTSIHKPEYCLAGQGFQIEKTERTEIAITAPHSYSLPVAKMTLLKEGVLPDGTRARLRGLFIYWFVADNQITADHNERMKWMARDLIFRRTLQRWAYVSCFAVCAPGQEETLFTQMHDFIATAVPQFQLAVGPASAPAKNPPPAP